MATHYAPWWKKHIVYQIYPRSFQDSNGDGIGDLRGIIQRVPYFEDLGVDLLWLCPIYASPQDDNGYDISDYCAIDPQFGTMDEMRELIDTAKAHGIGIMLDLVVNHTSDEHPWFKESRSSKDNPKRDWYIWKAPVDGKPPTEWPSIFGGSVWEYDSTTGEYYFHAFSRKQPDLNWENPEGRHAVYDMMNWWLDQGIAGFRVDAITFIKKNQAWPKRLDSSQMTHSILDGASCNVPGIMDFLREMRDEVLRPRHALTVAETPSVSLNQMADYIGGETGVFSMIFAFDHVDLDIRMDAPYRVFPIDRRQWKSAMTSWQETIRNDGWLGLFLENHDHPRSVSRFGNPNEFRMESAKTLATWYFLMRGTPFIYQGEELGMKNCPFESIEEYRDIASHNAYKGAIALGFSEKDALAYLAARSRDHSRTPMQWNAERNAGFTTGTPWIRLNPDYKTLNVNVEAELSDENSVLHHYKRLIELRKNCDVFADGDFEELYSDNEVLGGYRRTLDSAQATVVCNFSAESQALPEKLEGEVVLDSSGDFDGQTLKPWQSVVVLSVAGLKGR